MGRKRKRKFKQKPKRKKHLALPQEIKQMIFGVILMSAAIIIGLSFFNKAGRAGFYFMKGSRFLIGNVIFLVPLIFVLAGLAFFAKKERKEEEQEKKIFWAVSFAALILTIGITGLLGGVRPDEFKAGRLGYFLSWPFLKLFGFWVNQIIFLALIFIGGLIFWHFLVKARKKEKRAIEQKSFPASEEFEEKKPSIIKKIFAPKFKVKEVVPGAKENQGQEGKFSVESDEMKFLERTQVAKGAKFFSYQPPSLKLLEPDREVPTSGDTKINSAIIKKTLQNFGISVTMSEINIGPTVTQYTLKPAEGIKLSKITTLSNDLALALASHPIRIEAPIPGRSLVGIEVPNKGRAQVRLRNLIESPNFQKSSANLILALGRDVSGFSVYADLTKMPHLLVAGATGTGKTIFLNSLILSLLYQPSTSTKSAGPETLRFILVDPKRVEFPVYNKLPHLLCPVIYTASQTIGALRWLTGEMERRFDVLSEAKARDIASFNEKALTTGVQPLPFIVLIIDELADLMAAKGREIEAAIVRLAQMARAVGIHLVVATQRPSVEVITGLIKANITSRITFQVASQVDSRTVLDTSGAEKLLGSGDMLYISAQTPKPKRIQAAYVSEKEVRKVVKEVGAKTNIEMDNSLIQALEGENSKRAAGWSQSQEEEPLYDEAKKVVIETGRASASLLQRRLRVGYARAARLIDMLEEKGIVGPGEGAKPREVFGEGDKESEIQEPENNDGWEKV